MLYGVFNQCTSLREITTGLLAWDQRIAHLGIDIHPRRSTLADANKNRSYLVFEKIYQTLLKRHTGTLPDSRKKNRRKDIYIFDSTTITLFEDILKGSGQAKANGKQKGGIKVHTLLHAGKDVPTMVRFSAAAKNDVKFLEKVRLPPHSVLIFDRGYRDYTQYNRFTDQQIIWVTRHRTHSVYKRIEDRPLTEHHIKEGVLSDHYIILGEQKPAAPKVEARMVEYKDPASGKIFQFITNNRTLSPLTIAQYYQQRWQIEIFFKRIKQNYPLDYFLGDNTNAVKIQIWCALIADLLLKVIKKGTKTNMSFSNITGLIRLHLMTYMDLKEFLKSPEKSLLRRIKERKNKEPPLTLFET
jgi:hypothetical protein